MHHFDLPSAYGKTARAAGITLPSSVPHLSPAASTLVSTSALLPAPVTPSAPSTFCSKCGAVRTDVRFVCCGACLHARCVYPWPRKDCPICHRPVKGVQILPLEPFYRNGELVEVSEKPSKLRAGRWLEAELNIPVVDTGTVTGGLWFVVCEQLAETVMKGFNAGMLPLEDGTRLGNFICDLLQCTSARLSSKLRTGKRCFKYCRDSVGPDKILEYEQQQRHLSKLEEIFLHYLTKEEAAVASRYLQLEWRAQFVGMAEKIGQEVENRSSWVTLLSQQHRNPGETSTNHGSSSSAARGANTAPPEPTAPIATPRRPPPPPPTNRQSLLAMLVQMMIDRRQRFTAGQKTLGDLLQVLQQVSETDCCLLARATNWAALFVSAGLRRLLGFDQQSAEENLLGVSLIGAKGAILHPGDARPVDLARQHSLREINRLIDTMGNPQTSLMEVHINVFPLTLRLKGRGGTYVQHVMSLLATDDFILLHASGAPAKLTSSANHSTASLGSVSNSSSSIPPMMSNSTAATGYTVPPPSTAVPPPPPSLSAAPPISGMLKRLRDFDDLDSQEEEPPSGRMRAAEIAGGADLAMAFMNDFLGSGNGSAAGGTYDADDDDLSLDGLVGEGDYVASGDTTKPASPDGSDGSTSQQHSPIPYRENYDLYYSPPASFEQTMHNFLRHLPFEAVDIWVPLYDAKSGTCQLHFGGGAAVNPELQQWIYYSKNFHFAPNQGVPGRVFISGNPEFQDDVSSLDNQVFLRRDGAQLVGVHSTYGVPIIQPEMQNVLVLVFYSRTHTGCITSALQEFIRRSTASWRISTNVLTTTNPVG